MDEPEAIAIGVDIGGTEIKSACVGPDAAVFSRRVIPTDARTSGAHLLRQTVRLLQEVIDELSGTRKVAAVGLSVPGVIDRPSGRIELTVALTEEWNGYAAGPAVAAEIGRPVVLMNDAQAAAEGELRAGSGRGFQHFLSVTVGTGIGGGLVLDGKVYEGSRGMSGVIGHTTVDPHGLPCGCGNRGCLETVASGQAMTRAARAAVDSGRWQPDLPVEALDPRSIATLARSGDRIARELYTDAGTVLGLALANAICLLNLEAIVIGGGVARAGDLLLDPIREEIARRTTVFTPERGGVTVVQSTLDGFAGAVGTALGALRMVNANDDGGGTGDD